MTDYAVIDGGVVTNVIVIDDPTFAETLMQINYCDACTTVEGIEPRPGIGWRYIDSQFYAPAALSADTHNFPADGTTTATVTYTDPAPSAPTEVTFDVNGVQQTVALANGAAAVAVTASTPGPVTVSAGTLSIVLTATAPTIEGS